MKVSTPGRICLFGEHQDYLGLPVIAAAISRRIEVAGEKRSDKKVIIKKPNINEKEEFELTNPLIYGKSRDYFKSAIEVLRRKNFEFSTGFEVEINGTIPINSGTSSSSALLVSWLHFLTKMADNPRAVTQKELGEWAYEAEVLEFGEPGGMMDQYATAIGNVIHLSSVPTIQVEALTPTLGTFVLGDSRQPKDTLKILQHVKFGMLAALEKIRKYDASFDLVTSPIEAATEYNTILTPDERLLLHGNLSDRDILREALTMFRTGTIDDQRLGNLLTKHQDSLRDAKRVSTPKIDKMLAVALENGALGGKINGSGGGGCMFVYAPNNAKAVAEAIEKEVPDTKAYCIETEEGTREDVFFS